MCRGLGRSLERHRWAPMDDVIARVTDTSDRGRALRQTSPFAGVLGPRERWEILRRCRGQAVAS